MSCLNAQNALIEGNSIVLHGGKGMGIVNAMDKKILKTVTVAIFILAAIYTIVALFFWH